MAARYVDQGHWLIAFADEVLVRCARCGQSGVVGASGRPHWSSASFACSGCGFSLSAEHGDWVGPRVLSGRRPCGYCGHQWLSVRRHVDPDNALPSQVPQTCPVCGHESAVDVEARRLMPEDRAIDPHFGLALQLKLQCRHGTLWAYNARHLHELQAYVSAKLRISRGGNGSMFSRLPAWIKLARNRTAVLKALARLEAMLPQPAPKAG